MIFLIINSTWDWGNYGSPLPYWKSLLPLNAHLHLLETFYFSVKYWCFIDYISCLLCIFPPSYWCKSGPKIAIMVQIMAENHQKLSWNDANWPQCWKGATLVQKKGSQKCREPPQHCWWWWPFLTYHPTTALHRGLKQKLSIFVIELPPKVVILAKFLCIQENLNECQI